VRLVLLLLVSITVFKGENAVSTIDVHIPAEAEAPSLRAVKPASFFSAKFRRPLADNKFRKQLAAIITLAKVHEENGLPIGHTHYANLLSEAGKLRDAYCARWNTTPHDVEMRMPALATLRRLAMPAVEIGGIRKLSPVTISIVGLLLSPILLGIWCGLFGSAVHLIHWMFGG
jgi:hypothetical protein